MCVCIQLNCVDAVGGGFAVMRKRSRQQPLSSTDKAHHGSSAAVCDSSTSSLFCFPFFYLLLTTWIFLSTFDPTLSHQSGSNSWSVPWFSGAHADENNGKQVMEKGIAFSAIEKQLVTSNENNPSNSVQLVLESKFRQPSLVQDLKCRSPLLKEVLSLSSPVCGHGPNGACPNQSRRFKTHSKLSLKDSARRHVTLHSNDGKNEFQHFEGCGNEEILQQKGESNMQRDGVVDDGPLKHELLLQHEEQGNQASLEDHKEHQIDHQVESSKEECHTYSHDTDGDAVNVENDTQHQAHAPLHGADLTHNESGSSESTSNILNKIHPALVNLSKVHLRQEPGHGLYNYAADSKGAKILASNKEAKGASSILSKDRDKYFRTPCNVGTKFVDMELSEETYVVQVVIANHEFYSSNVKEFEVWGSSTYPADEWLSLGKFEAENTRAPQLFLLKEPQSVRYLKLQMISHYGSEFYCTLSMVEVNGVDEIESFLEDWFAEEAGGPGAKSPPSQEKNSSIGTKGGSPVPSQSHMPERSADSEDEFDLMLTQKLDNAPAPTPTHTDKGGDVSEGKGKAAEKPQQTVRPALDAVMKLLMQKVRSLEHKEPIFSQQLKDLDEKYKEALIVHSKEQLMMTSKLEEATVEIATLNALLQSMERKWTEERLSLQKDVLNQMKAWHTDLNVIRNQLSRTENKELVALAVSFFSTITVVGIQLLTLCASMFKPGKEDEALLVSRSRTLWTVPFLGCILVIFVLAL